MDWQTMLVMAVVSMLAALILLLRLIPWRTLIQFHWAADIALTMTLVYLFKGTLGGMIIAAMGGLMFSIVLTVGRALTPGTKEDT